MNLAKMIAARARLTPSTGYNVVGLDTFDADGEGCYLIDHAPTRAEAEKIKKQRGSSHPGEEVVIWPEE